MHACTVLVIDDEEPIRDIVRCVLEQAGHAVLEAGDGVEGLDLLRASDAPLVVLLDLMMPRMSGFAMLHALATEPGGVAGRHAYVIISSAVRTLAPADADRILSLPGKRLFELPKPFDLEELVALVEHAALQLDSAPHHETGRQTNVLRRPAPGQMRHTGARRCRGQKARRASRDAITA